MQNVKRWWGVVICMAACIILLVGLLIARSFHQPDQHPPTVQPKEKNAVHIVAKIGDRQITLDELQTALDRQYGSELLNQMLDREALRLEGAKAGIQIENAEIERELKRMQQGYENEGQFYQSMKEQLGMSKDEVREDVYNKLLLEKIATRNIPITDKQVDEYIQTHPDEFKTEVELDIQQITVSTMEQANKVITELNKGEDFAILARDRSIDDNTAGSGGDLGWLREDDPFVGDSILNAAKQLRIGEHSKPISLEKGFAVIRLKDRRTKPNPDQAFIRDNVRRELALRNAPPLKDVVKELRDKWGSVIYDANLK
jgi:foldase protein PrsA